MTIVTETKFRAFSQKHMSYLLNISYYTIVKSHLSYLCTYSYLLVRFLVILQSIQYISFNATRFQLIQFAITYNQIRVAEPVGC